MPAKSPEQQQAAAIALKAKEKGTTKGLKGPAKAMARMSKNKLEKFASTKHKDIKESYMPEEGMMQDYGQHPGCEDKIGQIFVVLKPSPESSPEDLVHQTHAFGMGQFEPQGVHGVYSDEDEANLVAEAACTELRKHLEEVEGKKHTVVEKIDKMINELQKQINAHMKEASEMPERADEAHELAERKMSTIKSLREKRKIVEASKKPLEELNEGFFDRMTSKIKGAGAQASTTFKNLGAFLKGDKDAIQDPQLAKSVAILKQKATTLKKELDDVQRDLEKLFPPNVMNKFPKEFIAPFTNYVKSLETVKTFNDRFASGNITSAQSTSIGTTKPKSQAVVSIKEKVSPEKKKK